MEQVGLSERLLLNESEGLHRIRLIPWGNIKNKNNATFLVDDQAAANIMGEFRRHAVALPIDVNHESTKDAIPPAQLLGAVGWIESIEVKAGEGIYGAVRWTDKGRELIRSEAFRYLSPVVNVNKDDRRVASLHSAAIVNKPAIPRMERLDAKEGMETEEMWNPLVHVFGDEKQGGCTYTVAEMRELAVAKNTRTVLGLDDDADELTTLRELARVCMAAANDAVTPVRKLVNEIAGLLGVPENGDGMALLSAILDKVRSMTGAPDSSVASCVREALGLPATANKDAVILAMSVRMELKDANSRDEARECKERIEKFVRANKLNPNDKLAMEACRQLASNQPEMLEAIMANATPYAQPGRTAAPSGDTMDAIAREKAIRAAKREVETYPQLNKLTSLPAYVNQQLRDGGYAPLTTEEVKNLVG